MMACSFYTTLGEYGRQFHKCPVVRGKKRLEPTAAIKAIKIESSPTINRIICVTPWIGALYSADIITRILE